MDALNRTGSAGGGGQTAVPCARLHLAEDVHLACIGSDAVLLDVGRDAYHCLPGGAALCRLIEAGAVAPIDDAARGLIAAGLAAAAAPTPRPRPPARPTRTVIHQPLAFDPWRDPGPAIAAVRHVRAARRARHLAAYLTMEGSSARVDRPAAIEAARRFWSLAPYLPAEGECLVRSALLVRFLRALDLRADWVFGVRLCPFSAHCWVQVSEVCLNDDVERLAAYTPIMVR